MKYTSAAVVLAAVLGALALLLPRSAPGQSSSAPDLAQPNHGQTSFYPAQAKKDPELDKLVAAEGEAAREVAKLVAEYRQTEDDGERTKIKPKLAAALTKQFEQQQKRRELELARAEEQLKKLRELMKKRGEEKKNIVDKRLDQLVREAEGLGWSAPPASRSQGQGSYSATAPQAK
jgi:hypothetical protein